jgi:hypothetical protein
MGWGAALVGALGVAQYQQQGAIGKYNQAVNNRNAAVAEQQAEAIENQTNLILLDLINNLHNFNHKQK